MDWVAVVTAHLWPLTCGVAKFSVQLAQRLGVPCWSLTSLPSTTGPILISLRPDEVPATTMWTGRSETVFDLFLHGLPQGDQWTYVTAARRIYAANPALARRVADERPDVVPLWCPSLLATPIVRPTPTIRVLTFGMAHKLAARGTIVSGWQRLRRLLDGSRELFEIRVCCGVHEGYRWEQTWLATEARMQEVFGDRVTMLGFLSDALLSRELRDATAVVLLYDPAVRANNTTLWAALEAGRPVITTLDEDSPPELVHGRTVFDLAQLHTWPLHDEWRFEPVTGRDWPSFMQELTRR